MSKKIKLLVVSLLLITACCFSVLGCNNVSVYHTVDFNSNGGTAVAQVEVLKDSTFEKPADPTKVGYIFDGWYLGEEEYSFSTPVNANITLDAKWAPATDTAYTVKHLLENLDGTGYEEVVEDAETLQGTTDALTSAAAKSYEGFTAQTIAQVAIAPDGSTVVEVKYDRNAVAITWVIDGINVERNYKYGTLPVYTGTPTKDADNVYTYEFAGWAEEVVAATAPATYTAVFNPVYINYTVVFKAEDGTVISSKNDYHYGDEIVVPADQVKAADNTYTYVFNGWNASQTVTGNLEYVASFTATYINYTVEFKSLSGAVISSKNDYHYGDTIVAPAHSESNPGYEYGWDAEVSTVTGNLTFTETRAAKTFAVTLETNGGEGSSLTSYVYGVGANLPSDLAKVGHDFAGWYASADFSGEAVTAIGTEEHGDKAYYAKWTPKTYSVTLNAGAGEAESVLTSYVYGVGASLPNCTKKGYNFVGWYASADFSGEAVSEITATDLEDKVLFAKYEARNDTKYTVQVLVANYSSQYISGYDYVNLDSLTYVDATQAFASVFGLDANNQAQGTTDSIVDLTAVVNALDGAKLNAGSVVSGIIDADESLELIIKLDVDEAELGFKLENMMFGQWALVGNVSLTLDYYAGVCGLSISGQISNGKELFIEIDPLLVANYAAVDFIYYEKSENTATNLLASATSTVIDNKATGHKTLISTVANPSDYVNGSVNLMELFAEVNYIKQINIKFLAPGNVNRGKNIFLGGIRPVEYVKETVTYNIENGNLASVVKPLGTGVIGEVETAYIKNGSGLDYVGPALTYTYEGSTVANRGVGIVIDLGGIRLSDYSTIKFVYQIATEGGTSYGANVIINGTTLTSLYGGGQSVDVKALAEAKGITSFGQIELSLATWSAFTKCTINLAYVELVVDENAPAHNWLYPVELNANGGTLDGSLTYYEQNVGATLPTASKTGYTFAGWYENSDLSGDAVTVISASDSGNKAYYAKWEANSYNVSFNLDGGALDAQLDSYVYGEGATLPTASKDGYTFGGWYTSADFSGEAVTAISASELGDKAYYAKWEAGIVNYSVQVLVQQYTAVYSSPYWVPGNATYVDATSEYTSLLGLDENNQLKGQTGTTADISALVANLKGAKVNAGSVLTGEILADGSLELIVKLDFDSAALGFNVEDIVIGEYGIPTGKVVYFTLKHYDGAFGLAIDGVIQNVREICIPVSEIVLADYQSVIFTAYEKSETTNTQISAISEVKTPWTGATESAFLKATAPADYVKASVDLVTKYASVGTIKQITLRVYTECEKHLFITGLEKVPYVKETVTYSIENGNLASVVKPLGTGVIGEIETAYIKNGSGLDYAGPALTYTYEGSTVADRGVGFVLNLGGINLNDYKTVKFVYQIATEGGSSYGANVIINGTTITSLYGGGQIVDVKALAEAKGITSFGQVELSLATWSAFTKCTIYLAYVELELKPVLCSACGSTEEAHAVCEYCGNHVCVGDHSDCKPVLCSACGSKEEAHAVCEYCGNHVCVGDHSTCTTYNVTLVLNGGSVEEDLTSYIPGSAKTLPVPSKTGYNFAGWYLSADFAGEAVSQISASDFGDKTFYAKWEAAQVNYSVQVLVQQYTAVYSSPYWVPGNATYVDATSEYTSLLGLDENNQLKGQTGTTADISALVANLKGAKVNAGSVLTGEILADGSLELIVKLDFDSAALGFNVEDIVIGEYGIPTGKVVYFTLKHYDGAFGLAIDGVIQNVREICIPVSEIVLADYQSVIFTAYEKSETTNTQISAISEVKTPWTGATESAFLKATAPADYVKASVDLVTKYASVGTIKQITLRVYTECEKHLFITGLEKAPYLKESATYNVENGKLASIATPVAGTLTTTNYNFNNGSVPALYYYYEGETITADHMASIMFNFGGIKVSDYKSIKITYRAFKASANVNTVIYLDNKYVGWGAGGTQTIDLIEKAKANNLTTFGKFELTIDKGANETTAKIYVESIVFELAPKSVTYSMANGNLASIATPVGTSTLSTVDSFTFVNNAQGINLATPALLYSYEGETITAQHMASVVFDLGNIQVSDYKTIKIMYYALAGSGNANTNIYIDGTYLTYGGGGANNIDVKSYAESKEITSLSELEVTISTMNQTTAKIYVAYIILEVAE